MATADVALPQAATAPAEQANAADQVSQWRLMWWRFLQNRLSVAGGILLVIMYTAALFAPFLSPYDANELDTAHSFAEPTKVKWIGLRPSVCPLIQTLDTYNFKFDYKEDCSRAV